MVFCALSRRSPGGAQAERCPESMVKLGIQKTCIVYSMGYISLMRGLGKVNFKQVSMSETSPDYAFLYHHE